MRVVSIGEVMVEMAPTEQIGNFAQSFSGDTFNTAWYLAQLRSDWQIDYLTTIGVDNLSDRFVEFAESSGINTDSLQRHPTRTLGLYMIELKDGERSFCYWRMHSAARRLLDNPSTVKRILRDADVIYFSGITMAILDEAQRKDLIHILSECRMAGGLIIFDPNLRPKLWASREAMCTSVTEAAVVSDIILPSFDDEAQHFGDEDPKCTILRYQNLGATSVIVKNGPNRIDFVCDGIAGEVDPLPLESILDSTAAGDSFNAGYIAAVLDGMTPAEAIRRACRISHVVIQERGALVSLR